MMRELLTLVAQAAFFVVICAAAYAASACAQ